MVQRLNRIGQTKKTNITYMDAAGGIDIYMAKMLRGKVEVVDAAIDGVEPNSNESLYASQIVAMMMEDNQ